MYLFKPDTTYEVSSVYCWHPDNIVVKEDTLVEEMMMELNGEPAAIDAPKVVTDGIVSDVIEVLTNARVSIFVTLEGIVIDVKAVQPSNAKLRMDVVVLGILIDDNDEQYWKVYVFMIVIVVGIVTCDRLVHPENIPVPGDVKIIKK